MLQEKSRAADGNRGVSTGNIHKGQDICMSLRCYRFDSRWMTGSFCMHFLAMALYRKHATYLSVLLCVYLGLWELLCNLPLATCAQHYTNRIRIRLGRQPTKRWLSTLAWHIECRYCISYEQALDWRFHVKNNCYVRRDAGSISGSVSNGWQTWVKTPSIQSTESGMHPTSIQNELQFKPVERACTLSMM